MAINKLPIAQRLHFIGIGGAGMSALAELLLHNGYTISGSDLVMNDATARLQRLGATISLSHQPQHVAQAEQVIFSSAIAADNPELSAARQRAIPVWHRSELLATLVAAHYGIAVLGSHGKTTTACLIAAILDYAGLAPAFAIGARLQQPLPVADLTVDVSPEGNCYFVGEADESDGSFSMLHPKIVVITNIDADHLDHYHGRLTTLRDHFVTFLQQLPADSLAILCHDDPLLVEMIPQLHCRVITYGFTNVADICARDFSQQGMRSHFILQSKQQHLPLVLNNLPGRHNSLNALAAIAVATALDIDMPTIQQALRQFSGVNRRLQQLAAPNWLLPEQDVVVVEDYGHHPNELLASMEAVATCWPQRRLVMVFQPHRFSRMRNLFDDFIKVLVSLDKLYLLPLYSAGEKTLSGASSLDLYRALTLVMGAAVQFIEHEEKLLQQLQHELGSNEILLMQGAGDIHNVAAALTAD